MAGSTLPLFPLRTVLFPHARLELRIFETRYLDLVRRSLRDDTGFGIVAIRRGGEVGDAEPFNVGTVAEIVDWTQTPDGLLGLTIRGGMRFRFDAVERAADGLYSGRGVSYFEDRRAPVTAARDWAARLLCELQAAATAAAAGTATEPAMLDEANRVCWNLAERLPLEMHERQALLETTDLDARFERLRISAEALFDRLEQRSD